jgi:protein ImuA
MASSRSHSQTIAELGRRLRQIEASRKRSPDGKNSSDFPPTSDLTPPISVSLLHRLLAGNIAQGTLIEWLAEGDGSGAGTLALKAAVGAMADGGALVVVDGRHEFYPPAAAAWGVDLNDMLIVRPSQAGEVVWALEQALRCGHRTGGVVGVSAVLCWIDELNDRVFRRLQLAAETGGTVGLLVRPARCRSHPSWADVRVLVRPLVCESQGRRLHLELLHCRGGMSGEVVQLDLCDETGAVHMASQSAPPAAAKRTTGA